MKGGHVSNNYRSHGELSNLANRTSDPLRIDAVLPTVDSAALIDHFLDAYYIYGLELADVVEKVNQLSRELAGKVFAIFADIGDVLSP